MSISDVSFARERRCRNSWFVYAFPIRSSFGLEMHTSVMCKTHRTLVASRLKHAYWRFTFCGFSISSSSRFWIFLLLLMLNRTHLINRTWLRIHDWILVTIRLSTFCQCIMSEREHSFDRKEWMNEWMNDYTIQIQIQIQQ